IEKECNCKNSRRSTARSHEYFLLLPSYFTLSLPLPTHRRTQPHARSMNSKVVSNQTKDCSWPVMAIGDVADINPRPGQDELSDDSLATFLPMKCVEEESGRFTSLENRKVADVRKGYTPFRDGDVIFAKVTPCMENGKAAVM